ncbi:Gfo/Idh/MocA family protein [Cellulomonas cellasea]|uniref:Inositol 2-dehydrogenase n=1 Tax=Cellulomonas cellasea TaxID=43670 RepID=A0A7W4Y970_9CELL|nr:Gfo/Idh/MocA family oxidoreductase [Cellulomonas cellasea]MBB2921263.1 myo-inositol 2-dehydrogenase/D-chiro-inositol 1-dehydrogenase [Cellulomonas cellasea]
MTVRIGVIGPGGMGRAHIARIQNELAGGAVVAVSDIDAANAARVADPLGAKVFRDGGELIASDAVDAVLVSSYGPSHEESVVQAIEAGKPVLCEKPLAPTADACLRIMAAEQKAGRRLVTVGFMRRFDASYNEMKAVLSSGKLGEAILVHNRHRNPTVPESYTADMAINDTAIHEIDTMRWLLDEEIVSVRVDKPRPTRNRFPHLQDPLVLVMQTESGVLIDDEVFVNIGYGYDIQCELVMETGAVRLADQHRIERRDASGARNRITGDHNDRFDQAFNAELQQWISAVERGEHTGSTSWDGYAAAVVCDAGVQSLQSDDGRLVPVSMVDKPALYA